MRKLAARTSDQQIAAILNKQGRRTGTGLPFNQPRVAYLRTKHGILAAPPPDPADGLFTVDQAADQLGVTAGTIYLWLRAGLLPVEQTTPHAPWRIRLSDEILSRFVPDVPDGYVPLDEAAKLLGCARQTVLHVIRSASSAQHKSVNASSPASPGRRSVYTSSRTTGSPVSASATSGPL